MYLRDYINDSYSLYLKITPIPSERAFNQFLHKNLSVQKRCGRCFSTIFCTKEKCIFGIFQPENAQFIFGVLLQNLFSTEFCGFPFFLNLFLLNTSIYLCFGRNISGDVRGRAELMFGRAEYIGVAEVRTFSAKRILSAIMIFRGDARGAGIGLKPE